MDEWTADNPVTIRTLRHMAKDGRAIAVLTCYDATTARWLSRGGVPALLVGDSAGQVILGHQQSMHAPLDFMIQITAAVKRGAPGCYVVGDMPFMSYQADDAEAIHNAGRFMIEGKADAVKLEVDGSYLALMGKLARAGVPVWAHLGWRPQRMTRTGVPVVAGRTAAQVRELVDLAKAMEEKGAAMLLIEQSTAETAEQIVGAVSIPVIGCGGGPACHGHVVVLQDLLGMSERSPRFVTALGSVGEQIEAAGRAWVKLLESRDYLRDHPYKMHEGESRKLDG
ncbi:MAG: 3-methyl-2-oxobutanoate hydroxymethyltransferase [Planctomycetaceae bacterium]|nr:3-methyl-2-oxobutanoate hydroxymethyltransferase [Planctomycetaceae bacterium]